MKIGSVVFAGLTLAVGLVYEIMALNMPRGRLSYPGPGLFPMIIGIFLIATALGCILQEILSRERGEGPSASPLPKQDSVAPEGRNVLKTFQLMVLMIGFGLLGYFLRRLKYDLAPLVLALVLGPMMERSFREVMMISRGDLSVFLTRPISGMILFAGVLVLLSPVLIAWIRSLIRRKS